MINDTQILDPKVWKQHYPVNTKNGFWLPTFLLLIFGAMTAVVSVLWFQELRKSYYLDFPQARTQIIRAEVVDSRTSRGSKGSISYYVTYQFSPEDTHRKLTNEQRVSAQEYYTLPYGSAVAVIYAEQRPEINRLAKSIPWWGLIGSTGLLLLNFGLLGIGGWTLRDAILGWKNWQQLAAQGRQSPAQVVRLIERRGSKGARYYDVYYEFSGLNQGGSPETVQVKETNTDAFKLAQANQPLTVRYLPENPKICALEAGHHFQ